MSNNLTFAQYAILARIAQKSTKTRHSNYNEEYGEYNEQGIPSPYSEQHSDYVEFAGYTTNNKIISTIMKNRGSK